MYIKTTHLIKIIAAPAYLDQQSSPSENHYVWAYTIQIENHSNQTVQLLNRHWRITDALGRLEEVRGPGVVGEQPVLKPGEAFRYSSGTALNTPSGIMNGTYQMAGEKGELFDVDIPAFSLDSPFQQRKLN